MSLKNSTSKSLRFKKVKGLNSSRGPVCRFKPDDIINIAKFQSLFISMFEAGLTFYDKLEQKDRYEATKMMSTCATMMEGIVKGLTAEQRESFEKNSEYFHEVLTHAAKAESKSLFLLHLQEYSKAEKKAELVAIEAEYNNNNIELADPALQSLIDLYNGSNNKDFFVSQVKSVAAYNKEKGVN